MQCINKLYLLCYVSAMKNAECGSEFKLTKISPHISPSEVSYGASSVSIMEKMDYVTMGLHPAVVICPYSWGLL